MTHTDPPESTIQWLQRLARRVRQFVTHDLWSLEAGGLPTFRALMVWCSRVLFIAVRGFRRDRCMFHAAALTYITVLSIVPVLAFMFSMAKGLGAYDRLLVGVIEPALEQVFPVEEIAATDDSSPMVLEVDGEESGLTVASANSATSSVRATIDQILEFVAKTDASKLGIFGLAILLWAVVKLLGSVERSFNEIWGVMSSRTMMRKVSDYLAIVVIIPIFMLTATAITASEQSVSAVNFMSERLHLGPVLDFLLSALPLLVVWVAFTFIYLCLPNRRMQFSSALIGGIGGGTLWQVLQVAHFNLQASTASYNALYAGFAAIPILLVWICLSWVTVLFGAELAAAHHKAPTYRGSAYTGPLERALEEVLALRALTLIAESFLRGRPAWSISELSERMHIPELWIEEITDRLVAGELLVRLGEDYPPRFLPARALESVSVADILFVLKGSRLQQKFPARDESDERILRLLRGLDEEMADSSRNHNLRELGEEAIRDSEVEPASAPAQLLEPG